MGKIRKRLLIYFIGVIFSWTIGFNYVSDFRKSLGHPCCNKLTYGDIAGLSFVSLFSWIGAAAYIGVEIMNADFWETQIK